MSWKSYNGKAETVTASDGTKNRISFRRKHQQKNISAKSRTDDEATKVGPPMPKILAPVSFTGLFRCARVEWLHALCVLITVTQLRHLV
jgi:hypothetical protein